MYECTSVIVYDCVLRVGEDRHTGTSVRVCAVGVREESHADTSMGVCECDCVRESVCVRYGGGETCTQVRACVPSVSGKVGVGQPRVHPTHLDLWI